MLSDGGRWTDDSKRCLSKGKDFWLYISAYELEQITC